MVCAAVVEVVHVGTSGMLQSRAGGGLVGAGEVKVVVGMGGLPQPCGKEGAQPACWRGQTPHQVTSKPLADTLCQEVFFIFQVLQPELRTRSSQYIWVSPLSAARSFPLALHACVRSDWPAALL